jgi:heme/copper-type cytochrome/quinol oxidase subunit 3
MWWATVLLMAMEGTTLALLVMSYFYLRQRVDVWPTTAPGRASITWGCATAATLVASAVPTHLMSSATRKGDLRRLSRDMWLVTLLSVVALVGRAFEFKSLPFRWDTDAYASVFWGMLTLHTTHLALGVIENLIYSALLLKGPVEKKHLVDCEVNGIYWYFVVGGGVVVSAILYGELLLS